MAVVVMLMAPDVRCAGVVFSADPQTGERKELLLNVTHGLADELVSGTINSQELWLNAADGAVVSCSLGQPMLRADEAKEMAQIIQHLVDDVFNGVEQVLIILSFICSRPYICSRTVNSFINLLRMLNSQFLKLDKFGSFNRDQSQHCSRFQAN